MAKWRGYSCYPAPENTIKSRHTTDLDLIKSNVYQIINTTPGERRHLPDFGCNLRRLLFDPLNEMLLTEMTNEIFNAISRWEDRIQVHKVDVEQTGEHSVRVTITVSLKVDKAQLHVLDFDISV